MSEQCFKIVPATREYVKLDKDCKVPIHETCEICKSERTTYHPAFEIGLSKPFVLLLGVCESCAKRATIKSVLTQERWDRMQMVLMAHGEKIPKYKEIRMDMLIAVGVSMWAGFERWKTYAMAA